MPLQPTSPSDPLPCNVRNILFDYEVAEFRPDFSLMPCKKQGYDVDASGYYQNFNPQLPPSKDTARTRFVKFARLFMPANSAATMLAVYLLLPRDQKILYFDSHRYDLCAEFTSTFSNRLIDPQKKIEHRHFTLKRDSDVLIDFHYTIENWEQHLNKVAPYDDPQDFDLLWTTHLHLTNLRS